MHITDFDFELPVELIAQQPSEPRDGSRLLVLDRAAEAWRDERFYELPRHLVTGDTLVVNNTRVFPARLVGERAETGGKVELFLIREIERNARAHTWETMVRPARRLRPGTQICFGDAPLAAEVIATDDATGNRLVRFETTEDFDLVVDRIGRTPLPPYIKRDSTPDAGERATDEIAADKARYQTIFARERGAIAAPTAGLHFTPALFAALARRGIAIVEITLHVGYGTFAPVRAGDLRDHRVAPERFAISEAAARIINERRAGGGRTVAVGTTSVRALESAATEDGRVTATGALREAALTITPGYEFRAVDALITNFHLPQSSLLMLTAAFAGRESLLRAYSHAVQSHYRFYSYGDAMLIV